jgi:hypothetical protein
VSNWRDRLYAAIARADPYLDDKVIVVSGLNFIGLLVIGEGLWKSFKLELAVYAIFCVLLFAVRRVGLPAMQRWRLSVGREGGMFNRNKMRSLQ